MEDAKAWFGFQEEFVIENDKSPLGRQKTRTKKIQWNKAIIHENGEVIEVAIKYSSHAVPMRNDSSMIVLKEKQKRSFYRLLIRKDSLGNYSKSILKFFPEQTVKDQSRLEVNNFMELSNQFSGDIQLTDWEENLKMGWHVNEGNTEEEYFPKLDQGKMSKKLIGAALDCIVTTYTICYWSGDDEGEIIYDEDDGYYDIPGVESSGCYTVYSTSGCGEENPSGPGWSGGGGGSGGSTGPGGGGGSGSDGGLPMLQDDLSVQSIASTINLSGVQKARLEQALKEMLLLCGNMKLMGYLQSNNLKLGFSMNSSTNGVGGYNYQTGNISFMSSSSIRRDVLQEELFHGYHNHYYSGGLAAIVENNNYGRSNIEFEAKLYADILRVMNNEICCMTVQGDLGIDDAYYM